MVLKKSILIILSAILLTSTCYASPLDKKIKSKGSVLIEKDSKRILYDKNASVPLPMASTTKIMTCIVALENGDLDEVVTASSRAVRAPKVKLNLALGEKQTLGDMLYSLMLESHNDTAVAIAEHIGGSVENFCNMMTDKAKEIGAVNTKFQTPNGLDAPEHYASAYDLAVIAAYALQNPKFVEIVNTTNITIPTKELRGTKSHGLQNKNRFMYVYKGAEGIKTGFTSKAGHCFVGAANRENMELVAVALGAGWGNKGKDQKYTDVMLLMDYGFNNYKKYKVVEKTDAFTNVKVEKGKVDTVNVGTMEDIILPLTSTEKETIYLQKVISPSIKAPVHKGDIIGRVDVVCDNKVIKSTDLVVEGDIEKATLMDTIKRLIQEIVQ